MPQSSFADIDSFACSYMNPLNDLPRFAQLCNLRARKILKQQMQLVWHKLTPTVGASHDTHADEVEGFYPSLQ